MHNTDCVEIQSRNNRLIIVKYSKYVFSRQQSYNKNEKHIWIYPTGERFLLIIVVAAVYSGVVKKFFRGYVLWNVFSCNLYPITSGGTSGEASESEPHLTIVKKKEVYIL